MPIAGTELNRVGRITAITVPDHPRTYDAIPLKGEVIAVFTSKKCLRQLAGGASNGLGHGDHRAPIPAIEQKSKRDPLIAEAILHSEHPVWIIVTLHHQLAACQGISSGVVDDLSIILTVYIFYPFKPRSVNITHSFPDPCLDGRTIS